MRFFFLLAMTLLFSGCHRAPLSCRSEYLYPDYLASEHVLTPDPCRRCFYGQQVVIYWSLPGRCAPDELRLHVRYGTREQALFSWPITTPSGYRLYRIINDEYWCREGIVSYKAELYKEGEVLTEWLHHLWVDVIDLQSE